MRLNSVGETQKTSSVGEARGNFEERKRLDEREKLRSDNFREQLVSATIFAGSSVYFVSRIYVHSSRKLNASRTGNQVSIENDGTKTMAMEVSKRRRN
jgi:hypothetical protein